VRDFDVAEFRWKLATKVAMWERRKARGEFTEDEARRWDGLMSFERIDQFKSAFVLDLMAWGVEL
jgi:hypothetical protein